MRKSILFIGVVLILAACSTQSAEGPTGPGVGTGNNGMMSRHQAVVPAEYSGLTNPIPPDANSLERGASLYAINCASCHGDGGMGDGPAASALDPAPVPVAHSSQMMADDYLFWRISEGGASFGTSMPAWDALDEEARWDMINYIRALATGDAQPASNMGGELYDPEVQATQQTELLLQAVEQGVITQSEAETFDFVHTEVERYRMEHPEILNSGSAAAERESVILAALVNLQTISQDEADTFSEIHDRLVDSGLMP
ncbi:cytochrome c [bacterium]|nr:cytochrome c [bacterium]